MNAHIMPDHGVPLTMTPLHDQPETEPILETPETGPPPIKLQAGEIIACTKLMDNDDVEYLGEMIAHLVHHGRKKYRAEYMFRALITDLKRMADNNGLDQKNARKILRILKKYGVTGETLKNV